jgi:23S rRNA (cytidine1920-2'-O)/16S rRNA (cytidine1409-2'-O)-methyltransferase
LPAFVPLIRAGVSIVNLLKPQFEVGRGEVGGGGIVRDAAKRAQAVETVNNAARELGLHVAGVIESPIQGAEGNVEFLAQYTLV